MDLDTRAPIHSGEKAVSSVMGKLDIPMQKNEIAPLSHTMQKKKKISLKWIKDLNIKPETITLLGENIEEKLLDIGLGNDFFMTAKTQATKTT